MPRCGQERYRRRGNSALIEGRSCGFLEVGAGPLRRGQAMSDEVELDTHELRDTLEELQEERKEREETERQTSWTRYVALSTALLAVFAAIGSVQSASLVND